MIPPHDTSPALLDVLTIDLGNQAYVLGRVSGWSGNHTKMAKLPPDFVQADRPWGGIPLTSVAPRTATINVPANLYDGTWVPFTFIKPYIITVLDSLGKQVAYEVMELGEPGQAGNCGRNAP